MKKRNIYLNDWLEVHPYSAVQESDYYYVNLANRLYEICTLDDLPQSCRKSVCIYAAAYLEDIISGLGLWNSFVEGHRCLYGRLLPFYVLPVNYARGGINVEDVRFIIWNTWQKSQEPHPYVDPLSERILLQAEVFYRVLDEVYEDAPANPFLEDYFEGFDGSKDADRKLWWLFGHTYLTKPSMLPYIARVTPSDRMIMPTGPLALFLHEWIDLLVGAEENAWKQVDGLYREVPCLPVSVREKNAETFRNFTEGTGGSRIVYVGGYERLHGFLTGTLKWPDDEAHTLPQMKAHRNFVLMANEEKGILLAKDVCEYIADPQNPLYDKAEARRHAFRMLTEEMLCPPDLLLYCIRNHFLPDAQLPQGGRNELVAENADFMARHSLLYYYRGD